MEQTDNKQFFELEAKKLQLHWLLQITKAINYNLPSSNLFDIYHSVLKDHLKVGSVMLFVNEGSWVIPVCYGVEGKPDFTEPEDVISEIRKYSEGKEHSVNWLKQFETIVPVFHHDIPLAYALIGKIDEEVFHSKREIITYIHTITNVIVVAIENKRLAKETVRQAAMDRELQLAAQMQSLLFPVDLVTHSFLDIAATYIPHQSVGGDYYDFIPLNDSEALVCMADVSGKGMAAAMLMSNFQANFHALIKHTDFTLENIITELNACVNRSARGEKFITFFIAKVSRKSNTIEYINAGHNPPMLVHDGQVFVLDKGTTGLGMFEELPFLRKGAADFPAGSILFCYTDGITDMENVAGIAFGTESLTGLLVKNAGVETMQHLHDEMVKTFDEYRGNTGFPDDVTFLSIRVTG